MNMLVEGATLNYNVVDVDEAGLPGNACENGVHKAHEYGRAVNVAKRHAFPLEKPFGGDEGGLFFGFGVHWNGPESTGSVDNAEPVHTVHCVKGSIDAGEGVYVSFSECIDFSVIDAEAVFFVNAVRLFQSHDNGRRPRGFGVFNDVYLQHGVYVGIYKLGFKVAHAGGILINGVSRARVPITV